MAKPNPRAANPSVPFHEDLRRLRTTAYLIEDVIASGAGCTVALYRAMESGQVRCTQALYDAAAKRFPQLSSHPRPGADLQVKQLANHPAVVAEHTREDRFLHIRKKVNVGGENWGRIADLLDLAIDGHITHDDVIRFFR